MAVESPLVTFKQKRWADCSNICHHIADSNSKTVCCARVLSIKLNGGDKVWSVSAWKGLLHPHEHSHMQRIAGVVLGLILKLSEHLSPYPFTSALSDKKQISSVSKDTDLNNVTLDFLPQPFMHSSCFTLTFE